MRSAVGRGPRPRIPVKTAVAAGPASRPTSMMSSPSHYDVAIIGAGMSGLAAGIRLAHFGRRVCIFERHYAPGGLNSFYSLEGRKYDVGLHAMTNLCRRVSGAPLSASCCASSESSARNLRSARKNSRGLPSVRRGRPSCGSRTISPSWKRRSPRSSLRRSKVSAGWPHLVRNLRRPGLRHPPSPGPPNGPRVCL